MSKIIKVSHFADSNRRPTHYECVALPTELKWRCGIDVRLFGKRSVSFQERVCRGEKARTSDLHVPNVAR